LPFLSAPQSIGKTHKDVRKFIVVEGVYANSGDLCPLPEIMRIARRHHFRVILDDSLGFGVLGKRGRGTAEHFGMERESCGDLASK
jgi:serine palmitoyltransferase